VLIRRLVPWLLLAGVLALALAFRLPRLDLRPMHTDEAVQAVKFCALLEEGAYRFDPTHYHGPTLYYATLPVAWAAGAETAPEVREWMLRLVPVLFGAGMIALFALFAGELGWGAVLAAGVLAAVSPGLVYYSRYYVQEALFLCFSVGMAGCAWRLWRNPSVGWALATGAFVGLLHATKETCIINFAALTLAAAVVITRERAWAPWRRAVMPLAIGAAAAAAVSVLFYTSFFQHARGPLDSILTYAHYLGLAGDSGHEKPWWYYLRLLAWQPQGRGFIWSEGWILALATVGLGLADLARRTPPATRHLRQGLAVYALAQLAVYSWIDYKTPWLAFNVVVPLLLAAGDAAATMIRSARHPALRTATAIACLTLTANLGVQAARGSFRFPADTRNPYVYSHTSTDLVRLMDRVHELAALHPDGYGTTVKVIAPEYWPIPWYLRDLPSTGYWHESPADPDAPLVIAGADLAEDVASALQGDYVPTLAGLRNGVHVVLYVERSLWQRFLDGRR
jgi:uncharacterized protein (TIGR03663 family)